MKKLTQKNIDKISKAKRDAGRKELMDGFANNIIPEQSDVQLAIPTHRSRQWISFNDFKQKIINGESFHDMCDEYNKNLIPFYSALIKNKINTSELTKDVFIKEYENGIELTEIAKKYKIPESYICHLREYYGIKRKGATYQKRVREEVELNQEAKEIIIGSILGDGCITPEGYFSEKHSEKQIEYLEWKSSFLKPILLETPFNISDSFDERYNSINYTFSVRTKVHSFLYAMRNKFYTTKNNKYFKIIPDDIEEMMTEKVLAIWFMDDGNTAWGNDKWKFSPQCKISTECFNLQENRNLQKAIFNKFQIETYLKFRDATNSKPFIKFNGVNSKKLIEIVKKFATSDLLYKVDRNIYFEYRIKKDFELSNKQELMKTKEEIARKVMQKYNITLKHDSKFYGDILFKDILII